mgnify:CR=1 FL=1
MGVAQKTAAPLPAKLARLLREAKWLVLVALAAYLLLILATYRRSDPGWSHSASGEVAQNAGARHRRVGRIEMAQAWLNGVTTQDLPHERCVKGRCQDPRAVRAEADSGNALAVGLTPARRALQR